MEEKIMCWRNKFSGEEGYVKNVSRKKGYFEATKDRKKAKVYKKESLISKDMDFLREIGEMDQNDFSLCLV